MINKDIAYWNIRDRLDKLKPINVFIGGRGIGKTYSTIDYCVEQFDNSGEQFLYLRNQQNQIDLASGSTSMNPFLKWNENNNRSVNITIKKKMGLILEDKKQLGAAAALSTFDNLRGMSLENIDRVILDEFVSGSPTKKQWQQFINMYELVNRNRELEGRPPAQVYLLSNSQSLNNSILDGLKLIDQIGESHMKTGESWSDDVKYVELCYSNISEEKRKSVVGQLLEGDPLYNEYFDNEFVHDDFSCIKKQNLNEYIPYFAIDDRVIYKHKSKKQWYVARRGTTLRKFNSSTEILALYSLYLMEYRDMIVDNNILYEHYSDKLFLESIFN